MTPRTLLALLLAFAATLAVPATVRAHALGAEAKLVDGKVAVTAFFDDDTPADDALVVLTNGEVKFAEGRTDGKGRWSCPAPPSGSYHLLVDAGDGHAVRKAIVIPANGGASSPPATTRERPDEKPAPVVISDGPTREQFVSFPWTGLALGLIFLGAVAVAFLLRRVGRTP